MRVYLSLWHGLKPWPYRRSWDVVATDIARDHGFSFEQVIGNGRAYALVRARQHVMYALSKRGNSSAWIGRQLDRDHSTVLWGIAAHARRVSEMIARACDAEAGKR